MKIQGVPSVFADGKLIHVGRGEFGELLSKLEAQYGINESLTEKTVKRYDVVVVGGVRLVLLPLFIPHERG